MNIVIIGAQKAGTSWLFSMLKQNPMIGTAFQKEIHYFDNRCKPNFRFPAYRRYILSRLGTQTRRQSFRDYLDFCLNSETAFTDEWYRNIFLLKPENRRKLDKGEPIKFLEASPRYMTIPEEGVAHMASALGDIEPILLIRDPVKRMISGLTMQIMQFQERGMPDTPDSLLHSRQVPAGSYSKAIPTYKKYFRNLHIIPFREISTTPEAVLRTIEQKYGLPRAEYSNLSEKNNSKTGKLDLGDELIATIKRVCEPEVEYLKSEFGPEFLNQI